MCAFLILLIFNSLVFADESRINEIEVNGTQRIDTATVISYSNVNIGDLYTEELGNKILKELFDTNLFSNIEISYSDNYY